MSYYVTNENSVLNINNAHLKVSGNIQTDVMKLGAIEFAPPASDVPGTVNFTNVTTGVTTTSNLNVGGTLQLGTVEVVATTHTLENTTALGNVTSNTVQFTNATTSLVASGNVVVTGNVTADHFVGDGSNITGISSTLQAITDSGPGANVTSNTVQFTNATTSLVASGNVAVDTNTLFVDSVNDRVGIGTDPSQLFHVHKNLPTTNHHVMARIGGDTSSYNTLVFGSKEGRPHIGGHRGDFGTWADLSIQDDALIISQSGYLRIPSLPIASLSDSRNSQLNSVDLTSANFYNHTWLNNGNHFNASTGRFTCPVDGIYRIYFRVTAQAGYAVNVRLRKDGGGINEAYAGTGGNQRSVSSEAIVSCDANDYLHIQVHELRPQGGTQHCQVTFQQLG